tara:strand:- start:1847 stop:2044 length:198 start_codon:yes stop_codon:yes gene_type:complete
MKRMSNEKSVQFSRGRGADAPVSDSTIGAEFDIPVHRKRTPEEWRKFMLAACGCPERVCGVVIPR